MLSAIQKRIFPFLIALTALTVSASAAFYSVSGLSKLFAGAGIAVVIMASSLEAAKLIIASLLYQYRKTLPKLLKTYLIAACVVLIAITSMGIYGFLSAAYQETAIKAGNVEAQVQLLEVKKNNYTDQLIAYQTEKQTLDKSISDLREGLAGNVIQYRDSETGQIITTTSSSNRKAFERQLDQALDRQQSINTKIDELNELVFDIESQIVETQTGGDLARELGPLKYLSGLTGTPMDKIINWLLLIIIFVFDPLAIALVIAANFAFEKLKPVKNIYDEEITGQEVETTPEDWVSLDAEVDSILEEEEQEDWVVVDEPEVDPREEEYRREARKIEMGSSNAITKKRLLKDLRNRLFS